MRVYCLGDSMTYGFGVSRREAWPALVGAATGHEMINGGVNGDATSGMLARFCVDVPRIKPNVAILMGGCNDIFLAGSDSTARCNMGSLVQQALSLAIIPVIGFPVPFEPSLVRDDWSLLTDFRSAAEILRQYVVWLRRYTEVFRVPFVDFWALFAQMPDSRRTSFYLDGLHLTAQGHKMMAHLMAEKLILLFN